MTFAELKQLQDGWLDGHGKAPPLAGVEWLEGEWGNRYPEHLPTAMFFPQPDGRIMVEWPIPPFVTSLLVDTTTRTGILETVNLIASDMDWTLHLDLSDPISWASVIELITVNHRWRDNSSVTDKGVK